MGYYWAIKISSDLNLITGLGRSPGEGKGYPLQYPGLENSMNYLLHGFTNSWTCLSDFHFHILSLSFPCGTSYKEPACQCRRYKRCGLDPWVRKIPWRRAWQPTPVLLPGESHGQRSLRLQPTRLQSSIGLKQFRTHAHILSLSLLGHFQLGLDYKNPVIGTEWQDKIGD